MADATRIRDANDNRLTADAAIAAGEVWQLRNGRAAVYASLEAAASGDRANFQDSGQYTVTKTATQVWTDGAPIYWDHSANAATVIPPMGAADKDFFIGCAVGDAASADVTGAVNLNVLPVYEIDLSRDAFAAIVVKTVVGSTTVEVPHVEPRGGGAGFVLGATAEAQKVDLLSERSFALASNWIVEGEVNVITNGTGAAIDFNIGVANATHATDADAITNHVFLHTDGAALDIFAQSKDGTTTVTATDTTANFVAGTPFSFVIDGRDPADVQIYIDGVLQLTATVFNVAAAAGPLKLLAHVEKTSDAATGFYVVNKLRVRTGQQ